MKLTDISQEEWSTYVGILTEEQKDSIVGQQFTTDSFFNPIQDKNDNWIISVEEMAYCTNSTFLCVKDLDLIPYERKEYPSPFEI
jgi:predicted nucleic acid-binding protein